MQGNNCCYTHFLPSNLFPQLFVAVVLISCKTRSTLWRLKCQLCELKDQEYDYIHLQRPAIDTVNPEQHPFHPPDSGSIQEEPEYEELEQEYCNSVSMTENIAYI